MKTHLVEFGSVSEVVRDAVRFGVGDSADRIDERLRAAPHSGGANPQYYNGYRGNGWSAPSRIRLPN